MVLEERSLFSASEKGPHNHQSVPAVQQQQHRPGESCFLGLSHWISFLIETAGGASSCVGWRAGASSLIASRISAFKRASILE